jgi:FkbM family methyltransferase
MRKFAKKCAVVLARMFPVSFWEFVEYSSAYLAGKGSGGDSVVEEAKAAARIIERKDGLVLFDVGANKGDWSAEMMRLVGSSVAKLYQFEPSPHNGEFLKKRFSDARISLAPFAVSDREGNTNLFSDVPGSGMASLYKRRLDHAHISLKESVGVSTITLDTFIATNNIKKIDFMKMDIEGAEFAALRGAERSLAQEIISAFSFEFGGGNIDSHTYFQDFWYFLTPLGFWIFRILPGGSLWRIKKYNEILESFRTTNYVAILKKSH